MEQRFGTNRIDIEMLREFCEREGEVVTYRKGEQMEREGDPSRWFGFVASSPSTCSSKPAEATWISTAPQPVNAMNY